jgi:hypothetical protein
MLRLSIPEPCHEDWNEMIPREKGAFCGVCSKTVVDFTNLSDEEVKNYFLTHRGQKTCGRFKNEQLTTTYNSLTDLLSGNIPYWKKFLAIVIILFGSFLTGCEQPTKGKVAVDTKDNMQSGQREIILGLISPEIKSETKINRPAEIEICNTTTVGIKEPPMEIMGDISVGQVITVEKEPDCIIPDVLPLPLIDSIKKQNDKTTNCDSTQKKDTVYYRP